MTKWQDVGRQVPVTSTTAGVPLEGFLQKVTPKSSGVNLTPLKFGVVPYTPFLGDGFTAKNDQSITKPRSTARVIGSRSPKYGDPRTHGPQTLM